MFQTAIGRIHSVIDCPAKTLDLWIFLDAGGKAGKQRVWGGVAAIGDSELNWITQVLDDIDGDNSGNVELKGRDIETEIIKATGRRLCEEERRIIFWANWILDWQDDKSQRFSRKLGGLLNSLKPNPYSIEQIAIESWQNNMAGYFQNLKPVNKHKLLSILVHLQWLVKEIERVNIGSQLKSVHLVIDNENFPNESKCGVLVKSFLSAGLQSVGMNYSLTGAMFRENAHEGAICVDVVGKSEGNSGIRFVDVLLQAVLRKVMPIE